MPSGQSRNPLKNFRRKSSGNVLDLQPDSNAAPVQSSFRVLERADKVDPQSRASTFIVGRPSSSQVQGPHAKSVDNLGTTNRYGKEDRIETEGHKLIFDRGSGGTTNSLSSGYYDNSGSSARHSSSSTLPSSLDADHDPDGGELFPIKKKNSLPLNNFPVPEPPPSFAARAGRAFSFGLRNSKSSSLMATPTASTAAVNTPTLTRSDIDDSIRDRALTTSSYASTARPPQLDAAISTTDFADDDFGNMFEGLRQEVIPAVPSVPQAVARLSPSERFREGSPFGAPSPSPDSEYPSRSASRPTELPSPPQLARPGGNERRYSWDSRKSNDQLISEDSSAVGSPTSELYPSEPQATAIPGLPNFAAMRGYSAVPNRYQSPELRDPRGSPNSNAGFMSAQSNRRSTPSQENLRLTTSASRERLAWADERPSSATASPQSRLGARKPVGGGIGSSSGNNLAGPPVPPHRSSFVSQASSTENTPRPRKSFADLENESSLFEGSSSPVSPVNQRLNPGKQRMEDSPSATPKVMTKAQFDQATRMRNSTRMDDEKSEDSETEEIEDEDEAEKQKKIAAQRRRQEATMSVYRQQMKKVAGGNGQISDLRSHGGRPPLERSSTSNLSSFTSPSPPGAMSPDLNDDEDEDVPLGVLQAHGFPSKTRPPTHLLGTQPGYASSVIGDGSGGMLPAFARRLPADPYFGAGLVNPGQRESMGFGSSGASVYGAPASPQMMTGAPGGLVGVIANEERTRAGRRGSPNPVTGGYGPIPLPNSMQGQQMPQMNRSSSMFNLGNAQGGINSFYPQDGLFPGMMGDLQSMTPQQQMAQLMQMQQQMMQQMMALQAGQGLQGGAGMPFGLPQSNSMNSLDGQNNLLNTPTVNSPRPASTFSNGRPLSMAGQGRSMTMTQLPSNWNGADAGQQRSNTMGGSARSLYAGSVYGGTGPGYSPSIAPSERSNVGMPSRYRPVSIMEPSAPNSDQRPQSAASYNAHTLAPGSGRSPSPLGQTNGNAAKPKSTIRIIEKLKGAPKSNFLRASRVEEDDDEEGWAAMARKKEAMRLKRANKHQNSEGAALADLYEGLDE